MNEYQSNICIDASKALLRAAKILSEAESDLFLVEGGGSLNEFYRIAQSMLNELHQSYYAKSQESISS